MSLQHPISVEMHSQCHYVQSPSGILTESMPFKDLVSSVSVSFQFE